MAKPYSILAAALVASNHSLSTVTVVAPIDCRTLWPTDQSEDWFADFGENRGSSPSYRRSQWIR